MNITNGQTTWTSIDDYSQSAYNAAMVVKKIQTMPYTSQICLL